MDLVQILGTGVTAAVLTQALAWMKDAYRDRNKMEIDRRYMALRLSVALERFSIQCADQIGEIGNRFDRRIEGASIVFPLAMPRLELPQGDDWRWISPELASDVFAIFPHIDFSNGAINCSLEVADDFQAADTCQHHLALRGIECWELAIKIRKHYEPPQAKFDLGSWDFIQALRDPAKAQKA